MSKKALACCLVVAAPVGLTLSTPARAADLAIGVEAGLAIPTVPEVKKIGVDIDGRLGLRLHLGPLWLQPEAQGGFLSLGDATIGRITGGGRLGLGGFLQPQAYVHAGGAFGGASGFAVDFGGALDLKISVVFVGIHGGYDTVADAAAAAHWVDLGAHAGLIF